MTRPYLLLTAGYNTDALVQQPTFHLTQSHYATTSACVRASLQRRVARVVANNGRGETDTRERARRKAKQQTHHLQARARQQHTRVRPGSGQRLAGVCTQRHYSNTSCSRCTLKLARSSTRSSTRPPTHSLTHPTTHPLTQYFTHHNVSRKFFRVAWDLRRPQHHAHRTRVSIGEGEQERNHIRGHVYSR